MTTPTHTPTYTLLQSSVLDLLNDYVNAGFQPLGICNELERIIHSEDIVDIWMTEQFRNWDKFSGSITFPVPSPDPTINELAIFFSTTNMLAGPYGELRKALVQHLKDNILSLGS